MIGDLRKLPRSRRKACARRPMPFQMAGRLAAQRSAGRLGAVPSHRRARSIEEQAACFVVRDHNWQALAYIYFEEEPGPRSGRQAVDKGRDAAHRGMMRMRATFDSYQSGAAAMVASLLLLLMAATAATSKPCLTKEEAKKLWPNEWLYWHTERHCWDHIKGTSGTYEERQPEPTQPTANVVPAPPPKQVTTTKERTPEIVYPTMVFNKADILEMMPLIMYQPWLSPQSISSWPALLDVDRPSFRAWDKRIGTE
jgi:hypothetical protein